MWVHGVKPPVIRLLKRYWEGNILTDSSPFSIFWWTWCFSLEVKILHDPVEALLLVSNWFNLDINNKNGHVVRGIGKWRWSHHIHPPPPPSFTFNVYESLSRVMTIAYGVLFVTSAEMNETLGHNCYHNI